MNKNLCINYGPVRYVGQKSYIGLYLGINNTIGPLMLMLAGGLFILLLVQ